MILLPQDFWEIKKVPRKGKALFAKKEIPAGTVVGDYLGLVVHERDEEKYDSKGHFYLMYYHEKARIYPHLSQDGIHVINHSCTPNIWMYTYHGHALYFAIRRIFPGEEMVVNYLLEPLDDTCRPCTHLCHCESIICSNSMHMTRKLYDKWDEFHLTEAKKTKYARVTYGKDLPKLTSYPETIEDAPVYTLFGNDAVDPLEITDQKLPSIQKIRDLIRHSGRTLLYPSIGLHIMGVQDDLMISKKIGHT